MHAPPKHQKTTLPVAWQNQALRNIFILDTQGSSSFVALNEDGTINSDPQAQDYRHIIPIGLFKPGHEEEANFAIRTAGNGTFKAWSNHDIQQKILEPARLHLKKHRGNHAYTLTAPEEKRVYRVFEAMLQMPSVASHLMESGYRVIVGTGITGAKLFRNNYPHAATGTFDATIPRTIFISGHAFLPLRDTPNTVFEEMIHALHSEALHKPENPDMYMERFSHLDFDEQVDKIKKLKGALTIMSTKILTHKPLTAQERKVESALKPIAQAVGLRPRDIIKDCRESLDDMLNATDAIYQKMCNTDKMDELTARAMIAAHELKGMYGDTLAFVFDLNGPLETYNVASHNLVATEMIYETRYPKVEREQAQRFGDVIYNKLNSLGISV